MQLNSVFVQRINEIVDAKMHEHYEGQEKRDYLGASMLGDECLRKVQLQYLGNKMPVSAQTLRTFDIGHCLECLVAEWLRIAGFELKTRNEDGEQFGFSIADGRLRGHVDGIILSFPEELHSVTNSKSKKEKTMDATSRCLWECKTLNSKSWSDTAKRGLLVTKPLYYAQIQLYMAYLELEQCLFTALNKDTSELYFELIQFDSEAAQRYSDRAVQIIKASDSNELMPCISGDPSFFRCKMCGFKDTCRQSEK